MSQPQEGAVEVNDVTSAAQEIERRMTDAETPTQEVIAEEESETVEAEAETQDEQESTEQEPGGDQDDEEELQETEEPESEEEGTFESLTDFAEALEMPMDEFMASIKTTVKVNGEELEVNLNDLKNGYQMESDYRKKTTDLAEQRKAFEQERTQQAEQLQNSLAQVTSLLTNAEQELINEYNSINWNELEQTDREEYLIQESKFAKRAQKLEQDKRVAQERANELYQQQQAEQQQQLQQVLQRENEALLTTIPEWSDPEVRSAEEQKIMEFAKQQGWSEDEVVQVYDHRLINLLRLGMKAQSVSDKVEVAKKKVKTLPKVVKPGSKQTKQDIASNNKSESVKKFKKTGDRKDLVNALLDRM